MTHLLFRLLASGCALLSAPLLAATTITSYGLVFTGGSSAATGTAGNSAIYTATAADGSTISATVTAWNATLATSGANAGKYVISQAWLGQYGNGLGVTSAGNDTPTGLNCALVASCGAQQIDNMGNAQGSSSFDFLRLTFSAPVALGSVSRIAGWISDGSLLGTNYDDDFSYGSSGLALANGTTLASLSGLMGSNVGNNGACGSLLTLGCNDTSMTIAGSDAAAIATAAAQNWYIGATLGARYGGDGLVDGFTLSGATVYGVQDSAVPEASTWAMMILGFGAIGAVIRRNKAALKRAVAE